MSLLNRKGIKFILGVFAVCIQTALFSQTSSLINYQAAARRADGSGIANLSVAVKFEILQGSATGSVLASETQTLQTNGLGLFSTQIGKGANLNLIDWQSAVHYLKVSIDTTAGSSFVDLGTQQFVSVPYAMQSEHVPSTYTNNILSIGKNTYTLSSGPSYTSGTGIAITSGSIVNTSPDQTVSINSGTNVNVSGTYPNFTISASPSLAVSGNSLSISGGNTVTLTTTPNTSLVASGAAAVTTLGTNSYSINVPQPTLTVNSNSISISGGNSVQLPSAPSASIVTSGAAVTTTLGVNSYSINVPQPTLSATGNSVSISGGNTVTVTTTPNTSLVASGAAAVATLGTNSYSINVPQPTLSATGNSVSISGGNTVTISTTPNTSLVASGAAAVATLGTNSYSINVPQPTLSATGNSVSISGGNTVTITTTPNTSLVASGAAAVATLGTNSYSINVPQPTLTATGNSVSISGGNTVTITTTPNTSLVASGAAAVTTLGTNSYSINVPQPTLSATGNSVSISGGNTVTITTTPNTSLVASGAAAVTTLATNSYSINVPQPSLSVSGNSIMVNGANGVAVPSPTFAYSNTTGSLTSGTNSAYITPSVTFTNNILTVGPAANSVAIASGWSLLGNAGTNATSNFIGTTDNVPLLFRVNNLKSGAINQNNNSAFFGFTAGQAVSTGSYNTGIGHEALYSNTTGNKNTAVGHQALRTVTSGLDNTGIGYGALFSNGIGNYNTGVGKDALYYNTTGVQNTGVGVTALLNNISGQDNTATGYQALLTNTVGNSNTANGSSALYSNTTGNTNTGVGYRALNLNSTGSGNTALGSDALLFSTIGIFNTAMGLNAMRGNTTGDNNTGIGRDALYSGSTGNNNVALGYQAGYLNNTGSSNVFIGSGAGYFETSSNKLYISNSATSVTPLVYGDFATGNVAIGTTAANAPLQFNNNIVGRKIVLWQGANNDHQVYGFGLASNILRYQVDASVANHVFYSGINSTSSLELMRITGTGNVGIQTSSPNGNLHVNSPASSVLTRITSAAATTGLVTYIDGSSAALLNYQNSPLFFGTNGINRMVIAAGGNVGIGTSAPGSFLVVDGTSAAAPGVIFNNMRDIVGGAMPLEINALTSSQTYGSNTFGRIIRLNNNTQGQIYDVGIGSTGNYFVAVGNNYSPAAFNISNAGNTGIGIAAPTQKLSVDGNISLDPASGSAPNRTIGFPIPASGNHGSLIIQAKSNVFSGTAFIGGNLLLAAGDFNIFGAPNSLGGEVIIRAGKNTFDGTGGGNIIFQADGNAYTERMRIEGVTGNVGIGTSAPAYQLHVATNSAGKPTSNVWTVASDARLKKDVRNYEVGLKDLLKIRPVWFTYTGEAGMPQETGIGILAQELQQIAPYMVKEWSYRDTTGKVLGTYLGVDNGPMTYMLINSVKEQQAQIDELKAMIEEQKKLIDQLLQK